MGIFYKVRQKRGRLRLSVYLSVYLLALLHTSLLLVKILFVILSQKHTVVNTNTEKEYILL